MDLKKIARRFLPNSFVEAFLAERPRSAGPTFNMDGFQIGAKKIHFENASYFLPKYALHRPACSEMLAGRFYEPETHRLIPALLQELGGNLVHAGTFFGDMIPTFARTGARIYAFEPVLENYVLARMCVIENELDNVLLFHSALGEDQGSVRMDTGTGVHRGGGSKVGGSGQISTQLSIDSVSPENVSIIQLDVEGYELPALKGAAKTIERDKPVILIEDNMDNCSPFLKTMGYSKAGEIPGLHIWTNGHSASALHNLG